MIKFYFTSIYDALCLPESLKWTFKYCHLKFKFPSLPSSLPTFDYRCRFTENFTKLSKTLQMSSMLLVRPTKMLHLQWGSSPKDDKRFNLLLAMSKKKMSNNLLRAVLVRDGTEMLDVRISTEIWNENGKGNCFGCWLLFGVLQDWYERIGVYTSLSTTLDFPVF